jgi:hypothetical protein
VDVVYSICFQFLCEILSLQQDNFIAAKIYCCCILYYCTTAAPHNSNMISSSSFYGEYHGHLIPHLREVHDVLRTRNKTLIFLAGDSSLDNKHWFHDSAPAVNGYEHILDPPKSRADIAYWMNFELQKRGFRDNVATINCAVEESALSDRLCGRLLPQDAFIRDYITENDVLVVSVGGNDIALKPSPCTICNILSLVCCSTTSCLKHCSCGTALPCDDCSNGCCCSCFSNLLGFPCGFGYFVHLFRSRVESFLHKLLQTHSAQHRKKPKLVVVCMIYYLDMQPGNSWAEPALRGLQYNSNPDKLKTIISRIFQVRSGCWSLQMEQDIPPTSPDA